MNRDVFRSKPHGAVDTVAEIFLCFARQAGNNAAHCPYWFSSSANYIVGSLLAYVLNKRFTFENQSRGWRPAVRFIAVIAVCYFAAYGAAKPLMEWLLSGFSASFRGNAALALGMIVFTALNYFGQRYFAFREDERHEP